MDSTWQMVATGICVALAALVVLRRVIRLFAPTAGSGSGCQTGCSTCPSQTKSSAPGTDPDFVSLDTLIDSSRSLDQH